MSTILLQNVSVIKKLSRTRPVSPCPPTPPVLAFDVNVTDTKWHFVLSVVDVKEGNIDTQGDLLHVTPCGELTVSQVPHV